jgi:uncharacterized membrane protein YfcA
VTTEQILFGLAVFLIAGTVKGLVGLGLPTITIALTSLVPPLTESIALIALPTIVTNIWQAAVGGRFRYIVRRHWPLIVPLMLALYLTMWLVGQKGPNWASVVLGLVLVVYGAMGLARLRLRVSPDLEKPLAPVIGVISPARSSISAWSMARTPSCRPPPWPHLWRACGSASASGRGFRSSNSGLRCSPHSR